MKQSKSSAWMVGLISAAVLLMVACGGGGGGSDGVSPPPATTLQVDEVSTTKLMGLAMFGQTIGSMTGSTDFAAFHANAAEDAVPAGLLQVILKKTQEEANALSNDYQADGAASGTVGCDYGGTMAVNAQWDGPNSVLNCSDMVNLGGTLTMNNCGIDAGTVMNGSYTLSSSGSSCSPTDISLSLSDFSFSDTSSNLSFASQSLSMSVSEITYSPGAAYINHSRSVIQGDVRGTMEGENYDADFYQFTQVADTTDNVNFTLDIFGSVRGGCLGSEWASIDTIELIAQNSFDDCPTAGELLISGTGALSVIFNADGSVQVGEDLYASCNSVDTACPAP